MSQIRTNGDGSITIPILHPYEPPVGDGGKELSPTALEYMAKGEVDEVTIPSIRVKHLVAADGLVDNGYVAKILEEASGIQHQALMRMDARDFMACVQGVHIQMGKSLPTGEKSSDSSPTSTPGSPPN